MKPRKVYENRLGELLEDWELPQRQLAIRCGFTPQRVNEWVRNKSQLPVWAAARIQEVYGVNAGYVLGISDLRYDPEELKRAAVRLEACLKELDSTVNDIETALWM